MENSFSYFHAECVFCISFCSFVQSFKSPPLESESVTQSASHSFIHFRLEPKHNVKTTSVVYNLAGWDGLVGSLSIATQLLDVSESVDGLHLDV